MLQRLLLSNALLSNPQILILDEPMSGLDLRSQNIISGFISALKESSRHIVIITSHDVWQADSLCDRVMFLSNGTSDCLWKDTQKKDLAYFTIDPNYSEMIKPDEFSKMFSIDGKNVLVTQRERLEYIMSSYESSISSIHVASRIVWEYLSQNGPIRNENNAQRQEHLDEKR